MEKMFLALVAFGLVLAGHTSLEDGVNRPAQQRDSTRTEQLKQAFERKDYVAFFQLFPSTYGELTVFYGYDSETGAGPLYDDAFLRPHIDYLFQYEGKISAEAFAEKMHGIAKDGTWDADGINFFQSNLCEAIIRQPAVFVKMLATKPDSEAAGFWYFVLDGPSPLHSREKFDAIFKEINKMDRKQVRLLSEQLEKVRKQGI